MSKRYNDGDVIYLYWDGVPEQLFVRGHMDPAEARERLQGAYEYMYEFTDTVPYYARMSMEPREDGNGHVLREYAAPGRGRFKVMMAEVTRRLSDDEWKALILRLGDDGDTIARRSIWYREPYRADGDVPCPVCGEPYSKHPLDEALDRTFGHDWARIEWARRREVKALPAPEGHNG